MSRKIEHKLLGLRPSEVKFDSEAGTIKGYASVFNGVDSYGDTIAPGAFTKTLENRQRPVQMRWNHYGPVIGKWTVLREDEKGLYVEGQLTPGHSTASDVRASLMHGAIDGLSIGFYVGENEETEGRRLIKEADLVEISVVEEPADLEARISDVKSAIESANSLKDFETVLRDSGLSKAHAVALVSRMKSWLQGELEAERKAAEIAAAIQRFQL
jgi:HK97 family phage prohead protease